MCMLRRNDSVNGKLKTRFTVGAALLAVSLLFVSCPREIGLGGAVDTQKPVVSITSPDADSVVKDVITLSGKATDETSLAGVSVTFQSTESTYSKTYDAEIDGAAGMWSLEIDTEDATNGLPDSKYEVIVTAKDNSGKTSSAARSLQIDNAAPTILVTKPSTYGGNDTVLFYKQIDICGEAWDASEITNVIIGLYKGDGTLIIEKSLEKSQLLMNTDVDGTTTWSSLFYEADVAGSLTYDNDVNQMSEPVYFYVSATDKAGNTSTYYYHKSDMYSLLKQKKNEDSSIKELLFPKITQIGHLDQGRSVMTVSGSDVNNNATTVDVDQTELSSTKHDAFTSTLAGAYPHLKFTTVSTANINWTNIPESTTEIEYPEIGVNSDIYATIQPVSDGSSVDLDSITVWFVDALGNVHKKYTHADNADKVVTTRVGEAVNVTIKTNGEGLSGRYTLYLAGSTNSGTLIGQNFETQNNATLDNGGKVKLSFVATSINWATFKIKFDDAEKSERNIKDIWYFTDADKLTLEAKLTGLLPDTHVKITFGDNREVADVPDYGATTIPAGFSNWNRLANELSFTYEFDKAKFSDGIASAVEVTVGTNMATKQVMIQKDISGPTLSITTPEGAQSNATLTVTGQCLEAVGCGVATAEYQIDGGAWTEFTAAEFNNGNWSKALPFTNEGARTLKVRAEDKLGNTSETSVASFIYDTADPVIAFTGTVPAYYNESDAPDITISGTAADNFGIDTLTVMLDNGTAIPLTLTDVNATTKAWTKTWSIGGETPDLSEGTHKLTFTAKDKAGKTSSVTKEFTVDTVKPVVKGRNFFTNFGTPNEAANTETVWFTDSNVSINVNTVEATSGIDKVQYKFDTDASWSDVSNPSATSFVERTLDDGAHTVILQAIDHAGNTSDTVTYTFNVDTAPSVLTVTSLTGSNQILKDNIYFTDQAMTITGTVQDNNGLDTDAAITVKVGTEIHSLKADQVTGNPKSTIGATWSVIIPVTDLSETGPKQITVQAKDAKGNTCTADTTYLAQKDTTGPSISITAPVANDQFTTQTVTVKGTCSDNGSGVNDTDTGKKLAYSIDGGTNWTDFTTTQFTGSNWQADVDFGSGEGNKTFRVRVSDKLGNQTETADVAFIFDTAEPVITFTADVAEYYNASNKPSITISGTATDDFGIKDNRITAQIDTKNPENLTLNNSNVWALTKTIGEGTPDLTEGNHKIVFTVTDKAGKTSSVTKNFFVDTGKPVIKSSNFFDNAGARLTDTIWFTQKFVTLNIKVEDGTISSGVGSVQYKFDSEADWSSVPNPAVSNTVNKEFADGAHSIQIKVTDKAGNESVVETFNFSVDTTPPAFADLTFEAVDPAKIYEKDDIHYITGKIKISGKITDANGLDLTAPLVAKYGTSNIPLTPAALDGSWYVEISDDKFSESATTTVTIEATDTYGYKTSTSYKVRKDVTYPALSVSPELTDDKKITDLNKRTFNFTITDTGSGIKTIKSTLNGGTAEDKTAEFSVVFPEGMNQTLSIVVEDQLGNANTYSYSGINVDAAPPTITGITAQPTYLKEGDVYKFGGTAVDNVGGTAADNIGLGEVRVTAKRDNVTITNENMGGYWYKSALIGTGPIALNIPDFTATGTAADLNGTWSFTIEVFDSADNIASEKREFTVDVSKPAAPTVNDYPGKNLLIDSSSPYQFRGTDTDVGTGIAKVQYCATNSAANADWADVTGTNSWAEGISLAAEGSGTMYFRAIDYAGNISDVTAQAYTFDTAKPSLDLSSSVSDYTNETFSITATAWDGWQLDAAAPVTMTQKHSGINGNVPVSITMPAGTSSGNHGTGISDTWVFAGLPVDATGTTQTDLVSGTYTYTVIAKDAAGKTITKTIDVIVDNTKPNKPVIEAPTATQIDTNAIFGETYQFRGTASDVAGGSGLKQIQYQFTTTDVEPAEWTNSTVGDGPWSFSMNLNNGQTSDIAAGKLGEGRWYLWVRAEDKAGNISAVEKRMFDVDLGTPTIVVTDPTDSSTTEYVKDSITIKGTATDTNGLKATDAVKVTVDGGTPLYATVTGNDWEITLSSSDYTTDKQLTATITVYDAVGKAASTSVPFYFDTTGPVVEINVPQSLVAVDQANYEIKGTVTDAGCGIVKRVYYTLGDTLPTTATETRADIAADGRSWSQTIELSGEGTKKLNILAEDDFGNLNTVKTVEFYYDLAAPVIDETSIGDSGLSTNTSFTLSGTVSDTNQLSATTPVQIQSSTNSTVMTPGVTSGSWSQTYVVGSTNSSVTNYISDGTTLFTIIAEDITGKTTRITRTVTVDTTPPSVSLNAGDGFENALVEKDVSPYNLLTVQASDTGAGATGLAGVYYQIADAKPAFTEATESSWSSMAQGTGGWIANVDFSGIAADGEVKAWVAAKDRVGNRFVFDTAITTWVDIHKPVLSVTGNDFTGGSDVTLTIISTDTNPDTPTVTITLPDNTASTVTVEANNTETDASFKKYTAVIPFSSTTNDLTADGTYTITINGKDTKGRDAAPITHKILRDKTAPSVVLTTYNTAATYQSLKTVTLTGTVTDPNLTTVTAQLSGSDATDIKSLLGNDGSFEWKQYDLTDDTYTITVVAKDKANNTTTVKTKDIIIDTTAPTVTFAWETEQETQKLYNTAGTALDSDVLTAGTTYLAKTAFTLKGVITEENFDTAVLNIKKDNVVQPAVTITSDGAWSYAQSRTDATYEYMFTAIDKAGNRFDKSLTVIVDTAAPEVTVITPAEGESFLDDTAKIRGTITDDGAGVKEVLYSYNGNAPSLAVDLAGSSWSKDINFATEGRFTLKVKASDLLGNVTQIISRNFTYDLYDPQLTETRIGDAGLTTNAAFGFSGKAWDSNALDEVTVTDGTTIWSSKAETGKVQAVTLDADAGKCAAEADVAADNWSIDFVVGTYSGQKPATWVADGTTTFTITVKDIAGKTRSYNRTVTIDTTKPTITKQATDGFSKTLVEHDGSPFSWLTVHAADTGAGATGLAGVYYQLASATPEFTDATESNWTAMAQGTNGWTVNVDFSAVTADGTVKAYVAAKDQAGNRAVYNGFFETYVDMTKPVLSLESGSGFTDAKADVELVVRVIDSNPDLPSVLIKDKDSNEITDPGVSIEEIPENTTATYKEYTITIPFKTKSTKYTTDGTYTVYIDGTDLKERQAEAITHKILRDTSAPTVTLTTYNSTETFISNGSITVEGNVTDGNLIKVEAWIVKDGAAQPVQDITNTLNESGDFTWKQYDLAEGVYYVHVKATDKAGLYTEVTSKKITVDKTAASTDFSKGPAPGNMGGEVPWVAGATYNQKDGYTLVGTITEPNLSSIQMKVNKDGTEIGNWTFTDNWMEYDPTVDSWGYNSDDQTFEIPKTVTSSADDGIYIYALTVIDKAGNREDKSVTVVVDTTAPTVSITTPGEGEFTVESSMTMRGTIVDDGAGADKVFYTLDGTDPALTTTTTADINGSTWTKLINFTDEGTFQLKVLAADVLGNETSVISRNFSYDLYDPGILETEVGEGGLTTNTNFGFSGKAWDSNQIAEITVTDGTTTWSSTTGDVVIDTTIDSKKNSAADVAADNWSIDFVVGTYSGQKPATWVADGTITFTIKITDVAGKSRSYNRTVIVDTTAPSITKQAGDGFAADAANQVIEQDVSPYNRLTMHASDSGTGLDGVYYQIADTKPEFTSATESNWTSMAQGMAGWTANVDFSSVTADGTVKAWIAAKDRVGNRTVFPTAVTAEIDLHKPVLSVTGNNFSGGESVLLTIRSTDTNPVTPEIAIKLPDGNTSTTSVTASLLSQQADYTTYMANIPYGTDGHDLTQSGTYEITISGKDANNRAADSIKHNILLDIQAPTITLTSYTAKTYLASNSVTVTGTVTDTNLTTVTAQLTGKEVTDITSLLKADDSFTWKQYDLDDGTYIVTVVAKDRASNTATKTTQEIVIDTTAPFSTFAYETAQTEDKLYDRTGTAADTIAAGGTYLAKTTFTLKGVITETNLDTATLNIKKDGVAQTPVTITEAGAWNYAQALDDAEYEYTLTIIDLAGNRYEKSLTVIMDTTAPDLTITTPGEGEYTLLPSMTIKGTTTDDGAGVSKVYYSTDGSAPTLEADLSGRSWSKTITFAAEGAFVLKVQGEDLLGNRTAIQERNFSFDLNDPELTETGVGENGKTTNAAFSLVGKVWDSNLVDEIIVTGQGKTWSNKTETGKITAISIDTTDWKRATEPDNDNWHLDFVVGSTNSSANTYLADGTTTFTITVKDVAGKSRSYNRTVNVDTVNPVITVDTAAGEGFNKARVEHDVSPYNVLKVQAVDIGGSAASGLDGVFYQIAASEPAFATAADEATWTPMAQSTAGWTTNVDFSSVTADGEQKAYIAAKDRAGNRVIYASALTTYVDMHKPVLSVESGTNFTAATADEDLVVRVTDTNPIAPTIKVLDSSSTEITDLGVSKVEIPENGTSTYKEYKVTIPFYTKSDKFPTDGEYTVVIDGVDAKNRSADTITHEILRDTGSPAVTVAISQPDATPGYTAQNAVTATGTATDSNLSEVKATLVKDGTDQLPATDIFGSLGTGGAFTWKQYDLDDGVYKVKISARDTAGHETIEESYEIVVDTTAPDSTFAYETAQASDKLYDNTGAAVTVITAGNTYLAKTAFTLKGVITETNFKTAVLNIKKDNVPQTPKNITDSGAWDYAQGAETDHSNDGTYVYTLSLIDQANNRFEQSITVIVDTTSPTLIITEPAANEKLTVNKKKFAGNVSDMGAGVKEVTYSLTNGGTVISSGNAVVTGASWAIDGADGTGLDLQNEGTLVIEVKATDLLDQTTTETTTFYFDQGAPTLTETGVTEGGLTTNAEFTFSGTAYDGNALVNVNATTGIAEGAVKFTTGSGASLVDYGTADVEAPVAPATAGTWSKTFTPGTGTGKLSDGSYVFTISVSDVSGRETIVQRTVIVDNQAPTINKAAGKTSFQSNVPAAGWYMSSSVGLEAVVADNGLAGINKVEYAVIQNPASVPTASSWTDAGITWKTMSSGATSYTGSAECDDGTNYICIRATDKAGNETYSAQEEIKVDTCAPSLIGAYEEQACTTQILTKGTNGQSDITLYVKTEDPDAVDENKEGSRVSGIKVKIGNKSFGSGYVEGVEVDDYIFSVTLDAATLATGRGGSDGSKTVYVQITDYAGNVSSAASLLTLQYDTEAPEIEFTSPATEATASTTTVNKTIKIAGKANDLQGLDSVTLTYRFNNEGPWEQIGAKATGNAANNWSYTFDTFNLVNHKLADGEDANLTLKATAKDTAGNTGSKEITVKIDQMLDRPEIQITNVDFAGMTSTNNVWLKNVNKLYGTVTDDDGVEVLEISTDGGASWTPATVTNGSFIKELPRDDSYVICFRVTDINNNAAGNGVFTSGETDALKSLTLKGSDNTVSTDGKLYITVDTKIPQMQQPTYSLNGTDGWDMNLLTTTTVGGTVEPKFTIKQYVFDGNGIDSVSITIDDGTPVNATEQSADTYTDPGTNDVYTAYTYEVTATGLTTDLNHSLKISVKDNAGQTNDKIATFKVDNTAPTTTLGSHEDNEHVRGTFFVSGTTQDAPMYGPATSLIYKVTDSDVLSPSEDWTTADTTANTNKAHVVKGNLGSWRVYFDDDVNNITDGYTHDRALKRLLVTLDAYKNDLEIATTGSHIGAVVWKAAGNDSAGVHHNAGDLYTTLTPISIHFKATDALGNISYFTRTLTLDPQGDIPTIAVAYPTITAYGWKNGSTTIFTKTLQPVVGDSVYTNIADMTTAAGTVSAYNRSAHTITYGGTTYTNYGGETVQGGIIRIQGTAEDEHAISGIYMQIDPTYDRSTGFQWDASGNAAMPVGNSKTLKDYYTIEDIGTSGMKGILVGNSVAWSTTLNRDGEFNGQNEAKSYIAVRLYALDVDGNTSPLNVTDDIIITIDSDSPQVGNSEELWLYQYYNNAAGTGTVTAQMRYEDDMSLKGEWWLTGSVEDSNGIAVNATTGKPEIKVQKKNGVAMEDYDFTYATGTWDHSSGYTIKFKIGSSEADTFGNLTYQIYALDKDQNAKSVIKLISVNYDNLAPVLATSANVEDYHINSEVAQSNGFYTLGSSLTEVGNSTNSQSGFERVAVYFVRPGSTSYLYDTYFEKSSSNNKLAMTYMTNEEGLYWKSKDVFRSSTNLSSMTFTDASADPNIHKGGLVKIGGTNYIITSVSGSTFTVNGAPAISNTSTMRESVKFAMGAVIVDHVITEGNGTIENLVNGYYTDVVNDDGDNIVEKVTTQGYTTFWEANICSRNIPDGAIEIHYVAFDKAGNYATDVVAGTVANNAPRLAGVRYGSDDNGDGTVTDDELITDGFAITGTGAERRYMTGNALKTSYLLGTKTGTAYSDPVLSVKGATKIVPEIVGGNNTLGYTYSVTENGSSSPYYSVAYKSLGVNGTDYSSTGAGSEIQDVGITLSVKDLLTAGVDNKKLKDGNNQLFTFTIWDSTEGMTAGTNSQKATLEMVMNVELQDKTPPKPYIIPFYWKSSTNNSVYKKAANGTTTMLGHIDLGADIGTLSTSNANINDSDDKVSGGIIIEGTANDNVLLSDIYMALYTGDVSDTSNHVFTFPNSPNEKMGVYYKVGKYVTVSGTKQWVTYGNYDTDGWSFSIVPNSDTFSQTEGHTVKWQLALNTEKLSYSAMANLKLAVMAQDQGSPSLQSGNVTYSKNSSVLSDNKTSGETTATQTNMNQFDVVPYILGIDSRLSSLKKNNPTVYNRTSNGHYPVADNEEVIIAGYNLHGIKNGNTTLSDVTAANVRAYYTDRATSFVKLKATTTGALELKYGTIPTLNNVNNNNAKGSAVDENGDDVVLSTANYSAYAYNRQPNGDNNQNLTDDVYLDVWSINTQAAVARDGGMINEPIMKINPGNGSIGLAFASGSDTFCMPNGTDNTYLDWSRNYTEFSNIALAYDSKGYSWGIGVGLDTNNDNDGIGGRMALMTSLWGRSTYHDKAHDNFGESNKLRIDSIGLPKYAWSFGNQKTDTWQLDPKRFKSPTLAVTAHDGQGTTTRGVYLAYYDRLTGQIRFRSGSTTATQKGNLSYINRTGNGTWNYVYEGRYIGQFVDNYGLHDGNGDTGYEGDANGSGDYGNHSCFEPRVQDYSLIAGAESQNTSTTTGFTAGSYVALDVIPGNTVAEDKVLVVFYDGSDLYYVSRVGGVGQDENVNSSKAGTYWSKPVMVFEGIGQNCTVKAGPDGSVHIACYDNSEGSLKYAYMSSYTDTANIKTATIDGYGIAGSHISIDVVKEGSSYIPYLSYYVPSIQKVKMAYLTDATALTSTVEGALDGADENDSYTGVWECAIVPTASKVNDDNTSIGFWKDTEGSVKVIKSDFTSNTAVTGTTGNVNGNGTTNPAIAYGTTVNTSGYIEVVQKK